MEPISPRAINPLLTQQSRNVKVSIGSHLETEQVHTLALCPMKKQEHENFPPPVIEALAIFTVSSPCTIIRSHKTHAKGSLPSLQSLTCKPYSHTLLHNLKKKNFPIHVLLWSNAWLVGLSYSHFNTLHKASTFHAPVKFIRVLKLMKKKKLHEDFSVKRVISVFPYFCANPQRDHISKIYELNLKKFMN